MQFFNRVFNWQTVAVPARHINRVHAFELARFDNHVLEDFVHGVTDMNLAIGIRRAVVQHKLDRTLTRIAQFFVNSFVFPFLHPTGFPLG